MRALFACLLLLALTACTEQRLLPQEAQRIHSLLLVVEPSEEVSVNTSSYDAGSTAITIWNPQAKRAETVGVDSPPGTSRGTLTRRSGLDVRERIRSVLYAQLSGRYQVNPADTRVPAIQQALNRISRGDAIADAVESAVPAGTADAILVVRGPVATLHYNYGQSAGRLERNHSAFIQTDYDYFLIDGRTFSVLAATGPNFKPAQGTNAPTPMLRASPGKFLVSPHAYRVISGEADATDMARFRETVVETIDGTVPLQLIYIGLLPQPPAS
jgi:hypothetical protein